VDHVVLGVAGGIAAYKSVELLRKLREHGIRVTVVPTAAALRFIGEPTWSALSGEPVVSSVWADTEQVRHVRLGQTADLVFIAPATADLMARAVHGIADDLLTNVLLTARCPIVMAPAMHTEMWRHPATQRNVQILRDRGIHVLEPDVGRLTGSDSGPGRLPDPAVLADVVQGYLRQRHDLTGRHVLVTAGGTREPLDPVRFLGNRSSGKQGIAIAQAAAQRGAQVTVITANVTEIVPPGITQVSVASAAELATAVHARAAESDVVVMAAAVADFRAADVAESKIKKQADTSGMELALVRNPDILRALVDQRRPGQFIIGFAAETGDDTATVAELGERKLAEKGCDLLVVNEVGENRAFGTDDNTVLLMGADGSRRSVGPAPKWEIAHAILDSLPPR
jgi:phosphopantothenoylcysteine decarboxylase / phosphopantothenate---cysteine ligase